MKTKQIMAGLLLSVAAVVTVQNMLADCSNTGAATSNNSCAGAGSCSYTEYDALIDCAPSSGNNCVTDPANITINCNSYSVTGTCQSGICLANPGSGGLGPKVGASGLAKITSACKS
jgi:hypothetical protein